MPSIFVWAVVTDPRGVLLVPASEADGWLLPGGPLRDDDESVEVALMQEIERRFGVRLADEPDFLDTQYERAPDGRTVVHNLFHVPSELLGTALIPEAMRGRWLDPRSEAEAMVPEWLRQGLAALYGDAEDMPPQFDLAEVQAGAGRFMTAEPVMIVTGPAGAGKSTVARELCRRFPRAAHIEVDLLRHMVVSGFASPVPGQSDPEIAAAQSHLATVNAATLARNFSRAGMVVVIDGVLETRDELDRYLDALGPEMDVCMVALLPDGAELARRDALRPEGERMGTRSEQLRQIIAANGETRGLRLDTSAWDVEQTVDVILERLEEGRVAG